MLSGLDTGKPSHGGSEHGVSAQDRPAALSLMLYSGSGAPLGCACSAWLVSAFWDTGGGLGLCWHS